MKSENVKRIQLGNVLNICKLHAVCFCFRYAVSFCMDLSLFGATVVVLILASQNVMSLFRALNIDISFCYWCIVLAAVLAPVSWLGSPKDFW